MSIEVRNLRKTYGDVVAIAGIDLSIKHGEMLVLLGPSGCGKTTTMRCIAGLEVPDSGHISIGSRAVFDSDEGIHIPPNKRHIGMVFQSYAIWPHMSVSENVSFPLEMEGVGRDEIKERVHDILELVGLKGFGPRGASYLSGGQMQRVALARSLIMKPSVLLFDEPLSNLDARLRDHLRIQLRELQTQLKITSIYVTHDQREALALADEIVVMDLGLLKQSADPVTLYRRPRTGKIADFVGYSNIFSATLVQRDGPAGIVALKECQQELHVSELSGNLEGDMVACVRPDDVNISQATDDMSLGRLPSNTMVGDVMLASYLGSHMQYRVKVGDGLVWEALSSNVDPSVRVGSRVTITIDGGNILMLPSE